MGCRTWLSQISRDFKISNSGEQENQDRKYFNCFWQSDWFWEDSCLTIKESANWTVMEAPAALVKIHDNGCRNKVRPQITKSTLAWTNMAENIGNFEITPENGEKYQQGKTEKIDPAVYTHFCALQNFMINIFP